MGTKIDSEQSSPRESSRTSSGDETRAVPPEEQERNSAPLGVSTRPKKNLRHSQSKASILRETEDVNTAALGMSLKPKPNLRHSQSKASVAKMESERDLDSTTSSDNVSLGTHSIRPARNL